MYETGERLPGSDKLKALADFFDVSTDYLVGKSDYKKGRVLTIAEYSEFIPSETAERLNIIITVDDHPLKLSESTREDIRRILIDYGYLKK